MKKLLSLVFASMLALTAIIVFRVSPVFAQGPYIGIYPTHITDVKSPDTFTVKINISCEVPFVAYQFYLYWDRTHINATGVTKAPPASFGFEAYFEFSPGFNSSHGRFANAWMDPGLKPITGSYQVATITFKVIKDSFPPKVVTLDLDYENTLLSDAGANTITPYYVYDGDVTVTGEAPPEEKHDISILSVKPSWPSAYPDRTVNVTIVVKNNGTFSETFNVTAYRNTTLIDKILVTNLGAGENKIMIFKWNTTGLPLCQNWTMKAEAPLEGDINPSDNTLENGTVKIAMLCDVNADRVINIKDLVKSADALGAILGSWGWNPQADIWPDGYIDIYDLVLIARRFGRHY